MKFHLAFILIVQLFLGQALGGNSYPIKPAKKTSKYCRGASIGPVPNWVQAGYSFLGSGYEYGFGIAPFEKGVPFDKQLQVAVDNARSSLVSGISVKVTSHSSTSTNVSVDGKKEQVTKTSSQETTSQSSIEVQNLNLFRFWQHAQTCDVYAQVRISESDIRDSLAKKQVEDLLGVINENRYQGKDQLELIHTAFSILVGLSSDGLIVQSWKETTLNQLKLLQEKVQDEIDRKQVAIVLANTEEAPAESVSEVLLVLKSNIPGAYSMRTECSDFQQCLRDATNLQTPRTILLIPDFRVQKINGFWVGEFNISLHELDANSEERTVRSVDTQPVRVMHRQKYKLYVEEAVEKWLQLNDTDLKKYLR